VCGCCDYDDDDVRRLTTPMYDDDIRRRRTTTIYDDDERRRRTTDDDGLAAGQI
jgi:hypothetical protein